MLKKTSILVVGAGQAGGRLCKELLDKGYDKGITLVGEEHHPPYERPPLSKGALKNSAGKSEIFSIPVSSWSNPAVDFISDDAVIQLDHPNRQARLGSGTCIRYEQVVLATGGRPAVLPIDGAEHCLALRTLDEACRIRKALLPGRTIAIIGGGVIGMEVAATARELGCEVTVLEAGDRIMSRCLPPSGSSWLTERHRSAGINILTNLFALSITSREDRFEVALSDQMTLSADLVISAVGITPNTSLAPAHTLGPSKGILTDATGQVNGVPDMYALGDVAETWNAHFGACVRLETWRNADKQARALARTLSGDITPHTELPWMWSDQLGHNIQVVGQWETGSIEVAREVKNAQPGIFWLKDGILTGGMLIDNGRDRRFLEQLVMRRSRPSVEALADAELTLKQLAKQETAA